MRKASIMKKKQDLTDSRDVLMKFLSNVYLICSSNVYFGNQPTDLYPTFKNSITIKKIEEFMKRPARCVAAALPDLKYSSTGEYTKRVYVPFRFANLLLPRGQPLWFYPLI